MTVTLRLGTPFREIAGGQSELQFDVTNITDLLNQVETGYSGFKKLIFDLEGNKRPSVNVYVNGVDIRGIDNYDTRLRDGDVVAVLSALSGG